MSKAMELAMQAAGQSGALNIGSAANNMASLQNRRLPVSPVQAPGLGLR